MQIRLIFNDDRQQWTISATRIHDPLTTFDQIVSCYPNMRLIVKMLNCHVYMFDMWDDEGSILDAAIAIADECHVKLTF